MYREGDEVHVSPEEAKSGRKGSFVFQVLLISLGLILAAMAAIYVFGLSGTPSSGGPVESEAAAQ